MLNKFLQNELKTSDVFDLSMTAKYFALTDLMQSLTANTWYDMRFYFDPISARIIPIGYDAQIPSYIERRMLSLDQNVLKIFEDPIFIKEYIYELNRITEDGYLENFFNEIENDTNNQISIINRSFPFVKFDKNQIIKNRIYIRNRLSRLDPLAVNSIEFSENKKTLTLEVFNKDKIPIKIVNLKIGNNLYTPSNKNYLFKEDDFLRAKIKKIKFLSNEDPKKNININKEKDIKNNLYSIKLNYKIAGIESLKSISTNVFIKSKSASIIDPLITRKPTHNLFPSLLKDEAKKIIKISDDLIIEKHLIIPLDYKLIISPGTKIKIKKGGSILVQGPLTINGEELERILFDLLRRRLNSFKLF